MEFSLDETVKKVKIAQEKFKNFDQKSVDKIFKGVAIAAIKNRINFAKEALEETKIGVFEDKVIKNHFAAENVYNKYKNFKSCGEIEVDEINGYKIIAEPKGVLAGIIPVTNPTSTIVFKTLIALKARCGVVFCPHPRAKNASFNVVQKLLAAAVECGAPDNIIACIKEPTQDVSIELMRHPLIDTILATGGKSMVKSAYSSGKPAIGVGAGNTPVILDETCDIKQAVSSIILSKTFDNGLICASEQAVIVQDCIYKEVKEEFLFRCARFLDDKEILKLENLMFENGKISPKIVGKSAIEIANMAGLQVEQNTKILIVERNDYSKNEPFAREKLSPVLTMYRAKDFKMALKIAATLTDEFGAGHTAGLFISENQKEKIEEFENSIGASRLLINSPTSFGAIGDLYNFKLSPSLTLGCGSKGGNSTSLNVGVENLLNYKTVAIKRENMLWFKVPPKIYFKSGALGFAIEELKNFKKAFVVTDNFLYKSGAIKPLENLLNKNNIDFQTFFELKTEPTIKTAKMALDLAKEYAPDIFIAFGGGSAIDLMKLTRILYDEKDLCFEDLALRFMDIRKRVVTLDENKKTYSVIIPTTSGTGSEVTPFSVVVDDKTNIKYPLSDYAFLPDMAIIDPYFVQKMPKNLTKTSGIDALSHILEAKVNPTSSVFVDALLDKAFKLIFKYLVRAYKNGEDDPIARENMHYAASLSGMGFSNAFLGLCHSMAHKLGTVFNLSHGLSNALLMSHIIKFNASSCPTKQAIFPQYTYPFAKEKYIELADCLNIKGNDDEKIELLIQNIENLKRELDFPKCIKDLGISKKDFYSKLDELSLLAFDDQCTGLNPRYPLVSEIKKIYEDAYYGRL